MKNFFFPLLLFLFSKTFSQTPFLTHGVNDAIQTYEEQNLGMVGIGTQNFEAELKVRGMRVGIVPSHYKGILVVDNGYGSLDYNDHHYEGFVETSFRVQRSNDDDPTEQPKVDPQTDFIVKGNGKTGVGFATPSALLHVRGLNTDESHNIPQLFQVDLDDARHIPILVVNRDRNVGINTDAPAYTLDVTGDARYTSNVSVEGNLRMNKQDIYFREGSDTYHGLGWYGSGKAFAGKEPDGPVLYGFAGGALGTKTYAASKIALSWNGDGRVSIGDKVIATGTHADALLHVYGKIAAQSCIVTINNWADDVFDENCDITPLHDLETYIKQAKHLPNIPTETEVLKDGVNVGAFEGQLLRKIEELTLYVISQEKRIIQLETASQSK